ncbi:cell division protein FtsK/SpoIIIE [Candidatus Magnetoovum chiemensis]|nr:cell division protein FtsK/SpoIIIE [Candidatus Magnetoovum chiemensis]
MDQRVKDLKVEICGLIAILAAIFLFISLFTYNKWDPSLFTYTTAEPINYGGIVGAYIADVLISFLGLGAYVVPCFVLIYGLRRLLGYCRKRINLYASIVFLFSGSMLMSLFVSTFDMPFLNGGIIGIGITHFVSSLFSIVGAFIFSLSLLYSSIVLLLPITFTQSEVRKDEVFQKQIPQSNLNIIEYQSKEHTDSSLEIVEATEDELFDKEISISQTFKQPIRGYVKEGQYILPDEELLSDNHAERYQMSKEELYSAAAILNEKLADFNVVGKIEHVHPGPIISMFEFEPAPGVKISKVVSLSDDLGRAMGGSKVRVCLIPGKTTIGIEVPNEKISVVTLKEIISSEKFKKRKSLLTLCLGKDIYGHPISEDLAKMPHLLVAGTTGSGKSVAINAMIMSILFKAKPSEVKLLMVDPKLLELSIYQDIPHLISHVITNPKEASDALKKMVLEMERRYKLIAEQGVRNIDMFNAAVAEADKLPYIVVIIDELADLMFTSSRSVEESIVRLAQMARASGIHLIVATQRPSVDVITGIIKANFPTRIAFQVSSRVDSRTILDTHGAEKLLGRGDMLLLSPGAKIMRVHGAYVSEEEISAVTNFVKSQGSPDYNMLDLLLPLTEEPSEEPEEDKDQLYQEVISYAKSMGEISISSIQRRFKIGYNRAARIMEMMAEDGLVGPPKGAGKPRDFVQS